MIGFGAGAALADLYISLALNVVNTYHCRLSDLDVNLICLQTYFVILIFLFAASQSESPRRPSPRLPQAPTLRVWRVPRRRHMPI